MKWREIVIILIIGLICFGAGYSVGVFHTANFIAEKAVSYLKWQNITIGKAELFDYFRRLMSRGI